MVIVTLSFGRFNIFPTIKMKIFSILKLKGACAHIPEPFYNSMAYMYSFIYIICKYNYI